MTAHRTSKRSPGLEPLTAPSVPSHAALKDSTDASSQRMLLWIGPHLCEIEHLSQIKVRPYPRDCRLRRATASTRAVRRRRRGPAVRVLHIDRAPQVRPARRRGAREDQLLLREVARMLRRQLRAQVRPVERGDRLGDAAERVDVAHDGVKVLPLEQVDGHEEVLARHADRGARLDVRADVLHLLEGHRARGDLLDRSWADAVDQLTQQLARLPAARHVGRRRARHDGDPLDRLLDRAHLVHLRRSGGAAHPRQRRLLERRRQLHGSALQRSACALRASQRRLVMAGGGGAAAGITAGLLAAGASGAPPLEGRRGV
eukprot:CAMPEP_0113291536 /NCGR_PEP_ID=MMETSP0008_2-20120614/34113_1 /TAXON_ID=97485 /ORGANISM="Prymnesium parvum" /LENGTH=315 /DNA_ID=CAMNT_0000143479 /DNA_START=115 /DNA_END=1063 /DNA_ORIENTATION=- /assembly_acc=CAM_ASM_000153